MFYDILKALPISKISGVGDKRTVELNKVGIVSVYDCITYYPRTYEDRSKIATIAGALNNDNCSIKACVKTNVRQTITKGRIKIISKVVVFDATAEMEIVWFNQKHIYNSILKNKQYIFYGKVAYDGKRLVMENPIFEDAQKPEYTKTNGIIPIYSSKSGLTQHVVRSTIRNALLAYENDFEEYFPEWLIKKYKFKNISFCLKNIHFPFDFNSFNNSRRRLAFEELLFFKLGLINMKQELSDSENIPQIKDFTTTMDLKSDLPFKLTGAQEKVVKEIFDDLKNKNKCMNRLVQGDVGSGKTVVAALALSAVTENGFQTAFMAPTEILANQHYEYLKSLKMNVCLLSGSMTKTERDRTLAAIASGEVSVVVGTHALIQDKVEFKNLGLAITDEQHRFGVLQRAMLREKGINPHILVMTATPIPRTIGLVIFADMDISIIDELPPGRKNIETYAVDETKRIRINNFIKKNIDDGRQVFIICPLVEDSDKVIAKSAKAHLQLYSKKYLKDYRIEMIHGRMSAIEKNSVMEKFENGECDVLISTTVVEVGIDIPNANIMIVENAERFGLAQLHQLRGRVGRGEHQSYCILFFESSSDDVLKRMEIMEKTNDGFIIAEKDYEIRGTGDLLGTRQHGLPNFRVANLYSDIEIIKAAEKEAYAIFNSANKAEKIKLLDICAQYCKMYYI